MTKTALRGKSTAGPARAELLLLPAVVSFGWLVVLEGNLVCSVGTLMDNHIVAHCTEQAALAGERGVAPAVRIC